MSMLRASLLLCAALAAAAGPARAAANDSALELKVKAAFLYNFARYFVWPPGKLPEGSSPLRICVVEPDPFGAILDDSLRGKTVNGHPIAVMRSSRAADLMECHIVYAADSDPSALFATFAPLSGTGVVTVHQSARAISSGVVRFFAENRKVRFEVNTLAASRENLALDAKLQNLAVTVRK